jgi:hypothetical protein
MSSASSTEQWYKVTIPAAERNTRGKILQNDFDTLFAINGRPKDAALFRYPEGVSDTHSFYFSPGAVAIARGLIQHFSGEPCQALGSPLKSVVNL